MFTATTKLQFCNTPAFFSTLVTVMLLTGCGGSSNAENAPPTAETLITASASANNAPANNSMPSNNTQASNAVNSSSNNLAPILPQAISSEQQQAQTTDQAETVPQSTQSVQAQSELVPQSNQPAQVQSEPEPVPQSTQPSQEQSEPEPITQSNEPVQAQTELEPEPESSQVAPAPQNTLSEQSSESSESSESSDDNQETGTQDAPQDNSQDNSQVTEQNEQRTTRILPLGDSITNGGEGFPSYRRSLWFMLRNGDYAVDFVGSQSGFDGPVGDDLKDFDLDHEGHWAWEAGELESNLSNWLNDYTPDIVLLHAGTNDVDRGQSHSSTISELDGIVNILREKNANMVILIAKIIPMQNRDTEDFNEFIESFADSKNTSASPVVIVDQHEGYDPSNDNYDNYHPNFIGEEKMATRWLNALQPYLN